MKYAEVMRSLPRLLIARDAEDYVASAAMLTELKRDYGLAPIRTVARGYVVYDRLDIDRAIERMKLGKPDQKAAA